MSNPSVIMPTEDKGMNTDKSLIVDTSGKQIKAKKPDNNVSGLIEMAINADLDIEKLERLMEMKEREEARTAQSLYIIAFSNFQAECPNIPKTGVVNNKHGTELYSYPKFDVMMTLTRPFLSVNGLSVSFDNETTDKSVTATCYISHVGGHVATSRFILPIEQSGNAISTATTRTNSANSLAKRICFMNALNLVGSDTDDDGASLAPVISQEDAAGLRDELEALEGDEKYFCDWLNISSLEEMPEKDLKRAQNAIKEQKRAKS